jgi:hypothetical protein
MRLSNGLVETRWADILLFPLSITSECQIPSPTDFLHDFEIAIISVAELIWQGKFVWQLERKEKEKT